MIALITLLVLWRRVPRQSKLSRIQLMLQLRVSVLGKTRSEAGVSRGAEFLKRDEFGFKGLLDVGKE